MSLGLVKIGNLAIRFQKFVLHIFELLFQSSGIAIDEASPPLT
jgi:hypothetical protein